MKRKIMLVAGKTFLVSIPKQWALAHNINKGDVMEVTEENNKLVLTTGATQQPSERAVSIDVSGTTPVTKRLLAAQYKKGFDLMEITFSNSEELMKIRDVITEWSGYEILRQGKHNLTVKALTKLSYDEFDNALRRIFHLLADISKDTCQALKNNDTVWLKTIYLRDKEVNRLTELCRRIACHQTSQTAAPLYTIVELLEKIGDAYKDICEISKPHEKVIRHIEQTTNLLVTYENLFYNFSNEKLAQVVSQYKLLCIQSESLYEQHHSDWKALLQTRIILESVHNCIDSTIMLRT